MKGQSSTLSPKAGAKRNEKDKYCVGNQIATHMGSTAKNHNFFKLKIYMEECLSGTEGPQLRNYFAGG